MKAIPLRPFEYDAADPLAAEHAMIVKWSADVLKVTPSQQWYYLVDLKRFDSGKAVLSADATAGLQLVRAALVQLKHWDGENERVLAGLSKRDRENAYYAPDCQNVQHARQRVVDVLAALLRRTLPLTATDLAVLLDTLSNAGPRRSYDLPVGSIVRAVERLAEDELIDDALRDSITRAADALRQSGYQQNTRLATTLQQLISEPVPATAADAAREVRPLVQAA